jgi:hypothetical protein
MSRSTWTSPRSPIAARRGRSATNSFTRLAFRTLVNDYAPTMESTPHEYELVTSAAAFDALVSRLTEAKAFAVGS